MMEIGIEIACILFTAFVISVIITDLIRRYSIKKQIIDVPNKRSAHLTPTPRGGGLAIVYVFLSAILVFLIIGKIDKSLAWALLGGGVLVAIMGFCDDVYTLKIRYRLGMHFLAASWALYCLHGFPVLDFGEWRFVLTWKAQLIALFGIVWCTNLYNFMDGIDGLAGSQGFFISIVGCLTLYYYDAHQLSFLLALLAAPLLGFLVWNFPPAKIFLGDVGSSFLGFVFAIIAIYTINQDLLSINFWLILLSAFICDATFTLLYRGLSGKRFYAAHCEHAYQRLLRVGLSHKQITLSIMFLNILILFPLSLAALYWAKHGFLFMAVSFIGLFILWMFINNCSPRIKMISKNNFSFDA